MLDVILYLHVLSAIMMGIYLLLPFLAKRVEALESGASQYGFLHVLFAMNRAAQYALAIAFLTGGYMVSKGPYSVLWMALSIILFLAITAISGIMGKRMRLALAEPSGSAISGRIGSIKTLSAINGILFFIIITLMKFPYVL